MHYFQADEATAREVLDLGGLLLPELGFRIHGRPGVRGIFFAQAYKETVGYVRRLEDGGVRTVLLVEAVPGDDSGGVKFVAHATRFDQHMNVSMDDLRSWLPDNTTECDVRRWSGRAPEERETAEGLEGPVPQHR